MRVYLDHNATTPLREEVVEAMARVLRDVPGNPSSVYEEGRAARAELDAARERVAALLSVRPDEIVFTAGASESNNAVVRGLLGPGALAARHLVTSATEHPSVEAPAAVVEAAGCRVTRVGVDADGRLDSEAVIEAVRPDTVLVSILWANNETGVVQDMERIAAGVRERGVAVHADATQAVGKAPVDLGRVPLDLLSLSAHKFNGPKGAGCLVVRDGTPFVPWLRGGGQERGRRGGTENVAGLVGLGVACELAHEELARRIERHRRLRDRLWEGIAAKVPRVRRNGAEPHVLTNTLNVEFQGAAGEVLVQALDVEGVAVSSGAACHSGSIEPSAVLVAMGRTPEQARGCVRFSVGHGIDEARIDRVLAILPDLVERARRACEP